MRQPVVPPPQLALQAADPCIAKLRQCLPCVQHPSPVALTLGNEPLSLCAGYRPEAPEAALSIAAAPL
jgi:hypothetical protein